MRIAPSGICYSEFLIYLKSQRSHKWNTSLFHIRDICERKQIHPKKGCTVLVLPIQRWVNTNNVGLEKFIDRGLVIHFVCQLWCRKLYFTVSVSFEGGLSRLLRKQMSILQRLIFLIRLAASSIPTFIYLLMYLLTYSFTHLCLDLVWFPSPTPPMYTPPPPPLPVLLPLPPLILGLDQQDKPSEEGR